MSGEAKEWLVIISFFIAAAAFTFAEAFWLNKKDWASFAKSFIFASATNFIGFTIGLFVMFSATLIVFMLVFEDAGTNDYGGTNSKILAVLIFGTLFLPVFLGFCKRLFLKLMKMQSGGTAWIFSFAASFLIVLIAFAAPVLLGYLLFR